ncbi:MAG: RdgB/HAM1 family non-canonical purine NTP pyrophosphatase [Mucinivorans sp.]
MAPLLPQWVELTTLRECHITEDIVETESTLEGNALLKARYVYERTLQDCFADDTGLEVQALDNAPGVFSARYAALADPLAASHDSGANVRLLLKNMEGVSCRKARFRTVIALIFRGREYLFEGIVDGTITSEPAGADGFGYDPVFQAQGCSQTFAQMSIEQKNSMSHRSRATAKLVDFLLRCK